MLPVHVNSCVSPLFQIGILWWQSVGWDRWQQDQVGSRKGFILKLLAVSGINWEAEVGQDKLVVEVGQDKLVVAVVGQEKIDGSKVGYNINLILVESNLGIHFWWLCGIVLITRMLQIQLYLQRSIHHQKLSTLVINVVLVSHFTATNFFPIPLLHPIYPTYSLTANSFKINPFRIPLDLAAIPLIA